MQCGHAERGQPSHLLLACLEMGAQGLDQERLRKVSSEQIAAWPRFAQFDDEAPYAGLKRRLVILRPDVDHRRYR